MPCFGSLSFTIALFGYFSIVFFYLHCNSYVFFFIFIFFSTSLECILRFFIFRITARKRAYGIIAYGSKMCTTVFYCRFITKIFKLLNIARQKTNIKRRGRKKRRRQRIQRNEVEENAMKMPIET